MLVCLEFDCEGKIGEAGQPHQRYTEGDNHTCPRCSAKYTVFVTHFSEECRSEYLVQTSGPLTSEVGPANHEMANSSQTVIYG